MMKPGGILKIRGLMLATLMVGLWSVPPALAHYQVYWPQFEGCYAKPGEKVTWQYFWGHPYDMLIDDAQPPKFFIFTPDKKKVNLEPQEITLKDPASGQDRQAERRRRRHGDVSRRDPG